MSTIGEQLFYLTSTNLAPKIALISLPTSTIDWSLVTRSLLCLSLVLLFLKYKKQQHETEKVRLAKKLSQNNFKQMPTPPAMPIIGHLHLLRDYQHNPWEGFNQIRKEFGNIVSLKMGIHPMALVSSTEAMNEILLKKGQIFSNRPNFSRHHIIFGGDKENSLALCDWSNTHRDRRKLCKRGIVPNKFSARNQLLEEIIIKHLDQFINNFIKRQRKQQVTNTSHNHKLITSSPVLSSSNHYFNLTKEHLLFLTSDIFMEFLCKESHSHSNPDYKEYVLGCDFVFWDVNQCYLIDFLPLLTSLGIGFTYLNRLKDVTDFLRDYIDDKIFEPRLISHKKKLNLFEKKSNHLDYDDGIVYFNNGQIITTNNDDYSDVELNEQKANNNNNSINEDDDQEDSKIKIDDYLDSVIMELLANKTSMSLADYKVGFADLLAGHAAVANILIRLLGHLALDQSIQDLICKEAKEKDLENLNHMPSLPVTEAALQEALRMASSPIVPHVAREDTSIDKFYIPRGTIVLFNNYHLNLCETVWKNPLDFNPMRFLKTCENGDLKLEKPKHFMPFSAGLRQCLGYKMVESTTILAVANLCKEFVIKANNENLVRELISPKGTVALNPDAECFELNLYPR